MKWNKIKRQNENTTRQHSLENLDFLKNDNETKIQFFLLYLGTLSSFSISFLFETKLTTLMTEGNIKGKVDDTFVSVIWNSLGQV